MRNLLAHLRQLTFSLLPSQCLLCACVLKGDLLCESCHYDLPYAYSKNLCQQCGLPINSVGNFCGYCLDHPPAFSRSFIPFTYAYPVDNLIHKFKYYRHLTCGKLLGRLLAEHLAHCAQEDERWQTPDIIIPVPMHWLRRWQRGFNQAEILSQYAAHALDIPVETRIIQRTLRTSVQKELTRTERQKNLRKAFSIAENNKLLVKDKHIALVDDVVTTTATVRELSQLLVKAGARDVQIWALARTMER